MSAGDWKDLYQAALAGNLPLVQHHISEGVNPNYQHPEVLCTPLVASLIHGHMDVAHHLLTRTCGLNLTDSRRCRRRASTGAPNLCSCWSSVAPKRRASLSGGAGCPSSLWEMGISCNNSCGNPHFFRTAGLLPTTTKAEKRDAQ